MDIISKLNRAQIEFINIVHGACNDICVINVDNMQYNIDNNFAIDAKIAGFFANFCNIIIL